MHYKSMRSLKELSRLVFYVTCIAIFFVYGCNNTFTSTNLVSTPDKLPTTTMNTAKVNFRILLPDNLRATVMSSPNAEISIFILNYGNATSQFTQLKKQVAIVDNTAEAIFSNVPAGFAIGSIRLNGATKDGFNNFHGTGDLFPNTNTTIDLAASGSQMIPDILANTAYLIASDTALTKIVPVNLSDKLSAYLDKLDATQASDSSSVYSNYKNTLLAEKITSISSGAAHSLAVKSDGSVFIWGDNSSGQIAETTFSQIKKPTYSTYIYNASKVFAGEDCSMAIMSDGTVKAWGNNNSGQIPGPSESYVFPPVTILNLPIIKSLSIGTTHALALSTNENIIAWGSNTHGELGLNRFSSTETPTPIEALPSIISISAGNNYSMALKSDGTVWMWGDNDSYKLGSIATSSSIPIQISGLSSITKISAGFTHCLALDADGTLWAWGSNLYGETGLATTTPFIPLPKQITMANNIKFTSIAAGKGHSLAVSSDGSVYAWGNNSLDEQTETTFPLAPTQIPGLTNINQVVAGSNFSFAIANDGNIWSWGNNQTYQLGKGNNVSSNIPSTTFSKDSILYLH